MARIGGGRGLTSDAFGPLADSFEALTQLIGSGAMSSLSETLLEMAMTHAQGFKHALAANKLALTKLAKQFEATEQQL